MHKISYHNNLLVSPSLQKISSQNKPILLKDYTGSGKAFHFFKRCFDIFFSILFILCILSWIFPVVSLLILLDSKGPVFFVQRRIGKNGQLFHCLKFRTMIVNAEADERQAEGNDYRITRMGKFLRRTNIDEFPQFINILIGDMSIIGPRPHMLSDCTRFSFVIPSYKFRNLVRPGITGLAQVKGHHGPTLNYESIFIRYLWDTEYIRNASLWLDLKIISLTILHLFSNIIRMVDIFPAKKIKPII